VVTRTGFKVTLAAGFVVIINLCYAVRFKKIVETICMRGTKEKDYREAKKKGQDRNPAPF
jgi:hypothetical protein